MIRKNFTDWLEGSSFARWQRIIATSLIVLMAANTGLFSATVHARTFEVTLDEFREATPEDLQEFGLVNVLVEGAIMDDRTLSGQIQNYCDRVQETLGVVCMITPWEGETASRVVEALQQMYFEGVEVSDGLASLVGLVIVGEVPLPVVNNGVESFPSVFPYTDLVRPAYVFDADQEKFVRSSEDTPQAEVWHGLIRPPGDQEERFALLLEYFQKNAQFYAGVDEYTLFKDKIGFHDHFWENDSFDNETKKWYLEKMESLDRLFNYRYSGEWLSELSGEAVERLANLTGRTFEDAPVEIDRGDVDADIGFDPAAAEQEAGRQAGAVVSDNADIDAYGEDRLSDVVPDPYSAGPIRNFLKDYINVVARYIAGTTELLDDAGRRQSHETLASLITKLDKYYGSLVYLINQEFEQYLFQQAEEMALQFELLREHEELNDFYTEEATDFLDDLKSQVLGTDYAPLGVDNKPKGNLREFGSKIYTHFVNGIQVDTVQSAEHCMLQRGSNFISDDGELGKAVTYNRKGNPLTSQDIAGVDGIDAEQEIRRIYQEYGYCSYQVQDRCLPGAAKRPVFDFGAAEYHEGDVDFRNCFGQDGPPAPKDSENASFFKIPSIVNHVQPTGGLVAAVLEKQLAHYFPIDTVRHASFYLGGASQYLDSNVARLRYPNFFALQNAGEEQIEAELEDIVVEKERDLRRLRVESNWRRYERYLSLSSPAPGRDDFWNYNEIDGFEAQFARYRGDVMTVLRRELDPNGDVEDYELTEQYLLTNALSEEVLEEIEELQRGYFPNANARQSFDMTCDYTFDIPPVDVSLDLIKDDAGDLYNPVLLADAIQPPDFNPPAITRICDNEVAKSAAQELLSLKDFYLTPQGAQVDMALLHKSDRFVEILDPVAVVLYFTPPPPPLPPNFNMQLAIGIFTEQALSLEGETEPLSYHSHTITPVPLGLVGELENLLDQHKEQLVEALNWLNLNIESKHKEALSTLSKDKEMTYLVMDGDAEEVIFTMEGLRGDFDPEEDQGVATDPNVLDEIRNRERALQEEQERRKRLRAEERRIDGEKSSNCGDSVPLLQWPGAVNCWLNEITGGPLIEQPPGEAEEGTTTQNPEVEEAEGAPGQMVLSQSVMTLRDRVEVTINLPLEVEVEWEGRGAVRVEPARDGKAIVVPESIGEGQVIARIKNADGAVQSTELEPVRVSANEAILKQLSSGDVRIGTTEEIPFEVQIVDADGAVVRGTETLSVLVEDQNALAVPASVEVVDGVGTFSVQAGSVAAMTTVAVESSTIARSNPVVVHSIAGQPTEMRFDFGDAVMGLDNTITGQVAVYDRFGNPFRAEGMRFELAWDTGLEINGQSGGRGTFFLVAGTAPLEVTLSEDFLQQIESDQALGYAVGYDEEETESPFDGLRLSRSLQVVSVDNAPEMTLPEPVEIDLRRDYRIQAIGIPDEIAAGASFDVEFRVQGQDGILPLQAKMLEIESEFGGEVDLLQVPFEAAGARMRMQAGASAGTVTLTIDDPDFGSQVHEIAVLGRDAASLELLEAVYVNNEVAFSVQGIDALGNPASLEGSVGQVKIIGDGAEVFLEQSFPVESDRWEEIIALPRQSDRIQLELRIEGFEDSMVQDLALLQRYNAAEMAQLEWDTPYMVMAGSAFGDYRVNGSIAQSVLFGQQSKVQALTTELTPHVGGQQMMRIWPSGRVEVGPDMKVEAIWENLRPVLVFSDPQREVARMTLNLQDLSFEVDGLPSGEFQWNLAEGRNRMILVPDDARYEARGNRSGDLVSERGERLVSFDDARIDLIKKSIETEIFADEGDVLILQFNDRGQRLARLYVHMGQEEVISERLGAFQWAWTADADESYERVPFFAGQSTADEQGMVLLQDDTQVRYSIGNGRTALDDVLDVNGQGFQGRDKSALAFLSGNTVGESTLLQSEGIVNYGDPVISLRQTKQEQDSGDVVPSISESASAAASDFSIGQLLYAPETGEVTDLLRLDVEGDGEDDLLVVVDDGGASIIRYLEGEGEGGRWGDVSDLLNLGKDVKQIEVVDNRSLLVLYENGTVQMQQNLEGRFIREDLDFSELPNTPSVSSVTVRDFDNDRRDDLLFLMGNRQLLLWYGTQTQEGLRFGLTENDRQSLQVMSVRLQNLENLKSALWVYTDRSESFEPNCREERFACQAKFFRGFEGVLAPLEAPESEEEIDRLNFLIGQSEDTGFKPQEEALPEQQFMVRLDQSSLYRNTVQITSSSHSEGSQLNAREQIDFEMRIAPLRTEDPFVMRFDLGADFALKGKVECEGCNDELALRRVPGAMWSLEGVMTAANPVTLRFSVEYESLPPFTFQVMEVNGDELLDIGINVEDNPTGRITLFESRGNRQFVETLFGDAPATSSSQSSSQELSDLMRGIGLEGVSNDQIKDRLLQEQAQIEASAADLFNNLHEDNNTDGYPDVYQENPSLFPSQSIGTEASAETSALPTGAGPLSSLGSSLVNALVPSAQAQAQNVDTFNMFPSDSFSNLDNVALMLDNIENDIQMVVNALKCSRGCLPLPINFAFLAPGPINVMGTPAGFDPGLPIFGLSAVPFFIWPPLVPYQATQFRIYLSPTLTLGLGVGICVGPYLLGQCFVFAVPIGNLLGSESVCDSVTQGLGSIMRGIQGTVGMVTQGFANAVNSTGVIKAEVPANPTQDIESILGVSVGGGTHNRGVNPEEQKVFLNPIPNIFVDWWDRQWEEVVNSLTDIPDITVRLPDFSSSLDRDYFDKLEEKVSGDTLLNLQELYDLINSLPAVSLHPDVVEIQVPWIEPGILRRIEQSLYQFLFTFMLEFIAFMRSFNLPCNITPVRQDLFSQIRARAEQKAVSEQTERCIQAASAELEEENPNLQQIEQGLDQCLAADDLGQGNADLRRQYFDSIQVRGETRESLNQQYDDLENRINALSQPQQITEIIPVFTDVLSMTLEFWSEQVEGLSAASLAQGVKRESVVALRSCLAQQVALDMSVGVDDFVNGIRENIEALEEWKEFPRKLARYLNALEFYIQEVVDLIDQITAIVLQWWSEFERKLDLWIDVIFAYQELVALIKLIVDILKGYNKKCGLCTSDRLTLKEIILKLVFGVVPKFPIIDFPNWPDVRLDFSDVQLGIDVTLPVFEVKTVDLRWPGLPDITFPRLDDFGADLNLDFSGGFSVNLPDVPLVVPPPPALPPLQPIPDLPQINLPNLPPAPEVPQVLEQLLPIMKIIQTILDIWCLINKSLIPIDEKQLKTQIENLTNRSLNLILPVDVLLTFDLLPGDLLTSLVPFDLIDVTTSFQLGVDVNPLGNVSDSIEQSFHEPVDTFTRQVDLWISQLRNTLEQGAGTATGALDQTLEGFNLGTINLNAGVNVNADLNSGVVEGAATGVGTGSSDLLNYVPPERPTFHHELFENRKEALTAYHDGFRKSLQDIQGAVRQLNTNSPDQLMDQLASLDQGNILVAGEPTFLKQQVSKEKRDALYNPENFVEKDFQWADREGLIAQVNDAGNALQAIQNELLDTENIGIDHLGVAVVRNGQVGRLQDYPLDGPVINVWDDDVLLAYENAVYLKSSDNSARRHSPYQGRVLNASLEDFRRSKVHQLKASTVSSSASAGSATVEWEWDDLDAAAVELTIWDSVGKAQRIDQEHLRFYLRQESPQIDRFQAVSQGVQLVEGQPFISNSDVRLRFGLDQLIIPRGVIFTIPAFELRTIEFEGEGVVELENIDGQEWTVELADGVALEVTGAIEMQIPAGQSTEIPEIEQRPYIRRIADEAAGALKSRVTVLPGEAVPAGVFAPQRASRLIDTQTEATITLELGSTFIVKASDNWQMETGRGDVVVSDDLEYQEATEGMVLMDDELVQGNFVVVHEGQDIDVLEEQQVIWSTVNGPSFEVTLPEGNYYGRIRAQEGLRGYSPIVHAPVLPKAAAASLLAGAERINVAIYSPLEIDAADAVFTDLPNESFHWQLGDQENVVSGRVYRNTGFDTVGEVPLTLYVRDGEDDFKTKDYLINVFIPELRIDDVLFQDARVIRVETEPPVANLPIGIVGSRDGAQDWLLYPTAEGSRLENRYYTNERGIVQLQPIEAAEGLNVIVDGGMNIARLYPNGRVVLHERYRDECQNEALYDSDGYVKFRVSCVVDGRLIEKFQARNVPHRDSDVSIAEEFTDIDAGVVIRSLQASIELVPLATNLEFAAGGAQVRVVDGQTLMVIAPDGQIELLQDGLTIIQKPFEDPEEPLVWQLTQNSAVLAEFMINIPEDEIDIIDPLERDDVQGDQDEDGMLDAWERSYAVDDPVADPDTDGLTNLEEFQLGTHPLNIDTDGDGFTDGEEEDPLDNASQTRRIQFSDVDQNSPYFESIMSLASFGFINGYDDGTFKPDQLVTRAEAIKILMSVIRCENCQNPTEETRSILDPLKKGFEYFVEFHDGFFNNASDIEIKNFAFGEEAVRTVDDVIRTYLDVQQGDWFYHCIEIATDLGLVNGYTGFVGDTNALGTFLPLRDVNIAELAKMVTEAVGMSGKASDRTYGAEFGWWNDPQNNYMARAEEDFELLLNVEDYLNPERSATRAEVAYAAFKVLQENGVLDFDGDGIANESDRCPCQPQPFDQSGLPGLPNGCPMAFEPRRPERLFEGIEIMQGPECRCLALVDADLLNNARFFAVISSEDEEEILEQSNTVP